MLKKGWKKQDKISTVIMDEKIKPKLIILYFFKLSFAGFKWSNL